MTSAAPRERHQPPAVGIRILREAHGLTIPALVERIGHQGVTVTADHISNVELGWKRPSIALLHAWAKALGITRLDVVTAESMAEQVPA